MEEDLDKRVARHGEALAAATARIGPVRRRLSDREAQQIVTDEFSVRGVNMSASGAAGIARSILHPHWPLLHPIKARRAGWTWKRPD